ncbi:branched-chain amino acid ABC transporter permease [Pusillimonas sp. T2]|uniref:branched-chain amino acid ABC transporter permease n=1 Tax=Pusillimonas sp. T2 TaxID=1548123 RepID=UPI000B946552|nr:branched-chain amino acid ABC transporter permease [Pusillimonas sp. T2]OXR49474.1 branched-chain amino acid ABC transporter permease [Pusillimonas sp. T2]
MKSHSSTITRGAWRWEEPLFWIAIAIAPLAFPNYLPLLSQILIIGLFAVSLDLLVGYAGIVSLGHGAFFGIGAYTAGILMQRGLGEPFLGLILAALVSACVGYVISFLLQKVRGVALLIVTLGVGLLFLELAIHFKSITGGEDGIQGIDVWPLFSVFEFDFLGRTSFFYSLLVCGLLYLVVRLIIRSNYGLSIEAIRDNERRATAIGTPAIKRLRTLFTIAAAVAGVAGALYAQTTQFVALEAISLDRSVSALVMVTLGGIGTAIGAMIGSAIFMTARDMFATMEPIYWNFWFGCLLFVIVCLGQDGVLGLIAKITNKIKPRDKMEPTP